MITMLLNSGYTLPQMIIIGGIFIIVLVFSLSIHEVMHGYAAYKLGDDTARLQGRLTLNPLVHLDPVGTLMMLLAGFGWAKPVPVNYNRLKRFKDRFISIRIVSLAGVAANFVIALVSYLLLNTLTVVGLYAGFFRIQDSIGDPGLGFGTTLYLVAMMLFQYLYFFNLMLMSFNLLPLPPLDGYHFIETFLPYKIKQKIAAYERYFGLVLLGLILAGNFLGIPILSSIINFIMIPFKFAIEVPIDALFGLFL